jgi:hypothetical protein
MSAVETEQTTTVADYTHPEWCDLDKCEPNGLPDFRRRASGVHYSTGLVWGLQSDEAEFLIELVRSDDYHPRTGENAAVTRLKLTLQQMVGDADDPRAGDYADAWVDAKDARMLATFLTRYADMAERSDRFPKHELRANEVSRRRRSS